MFVLFFGAFLRAIPIGPVQALLFNCLIEVRNCKGVLMYVPKAKIKEWFGCGIPRLNDCADFDLTLVFLAVPRQCEVNWDALGS